MLDIVHERLDRGQPGVPGAGAVPPNGLQVFEELEHQGRVNVLELQG